MTMHKPRRSRVMRIHISRAFGSLSDKRRCEKLVRAAVTRALHDFDNGSKPCYTIRDKLDDFLGERIAGIDCKPCNARTAALYRRRLMMFDGVFHSATLDAISLEEVKGWMKRRLTKPRRGDSVSGDAVNAEIGALKTFARWAQANGFAPDSLPLLLAPRIQSTGKMAGKNWRPPEAMDMDPLLDIIDAVKAERRDIGLFFQGMLYFNLRPSEAAALKRADLRLPAGGRDGSLKVFRIKTHQPQTLPVPHASFAHGWARECLELARLTLSRVGDGTPLIISITGRSRRNPHGWTTDTLDKATARVCAKLGIKLSRPYIIRHSVISWLDEQPDVAAAAISAHASHLKSTTTDGYKHRKAAHAKPAFVAIESLMKSRYTKTG